MSLESESYFMKVADELVEMAEFDQELKDGLQWIDSIAQKSGNSFYEVLAATFIKHDVNNKAKEWMRDKNK